MHTKELHQTNLCNDDITTITAIGNLLSDLDNFYNF